MATSETVALSLPDGYAKGPPDAFIDDHEFCHIHPPPHGSLHLILPRRIGEVADRLGWAETHAIAKVGMLPDTIMLAYAPRNEQELEVVLFLVTASYEFARGRLT